MTFKLKYKKTKKRMRNVHNQLLLHCLNLLDKQKSITPNIEILLPDWQQQTYENNQATDPIS